MDDSDIRDSKAVCLARMMALVKEDQGLWKAEELGPILQHQLAAAVQLDLGRLDRLSAERLEALCSQATPPIETFRDLLHHPRPPVELLEMTKNFARACHGGAESLLPNEVATVLYISSIVAAKLQCQRRITKLDSQGLKHMLDWALDQPWLDESTRGLLEAGSRAVRPVESESDA